MSSFDPDDTTPLINPQDGNVNHGTFNGTNQDGDDDPMEEGAEQNVVSDEEILDGRPNSGAQRFNPFDRVPNLPPRLVEELSAGVIIGEPESNWTRFKRYVIISINPCHRITNDLIVSIDSLALVNKHQTTLPRHL